VRIGGTTVRIAVAHGLGHVETVLDRIRAAKASGEEPPYHLVEVMACPGGCIGGGGQSWGVTDQIRRQRVTGLLEEDAGKTIRVSHKNASVQKLYEEFLGHPMSEKSHKLLHTAYKAIPQYRR